MGHKEVGEREPDESEHIDTDALRDAIYWLIDGFEREHGCVVTMAEYTLWHPDYPERTYKDCTVHAEREK